MSATGDYLEVSGWAADALTGAPVENVEIRLSDRAIGIAQLGLEREDVARAFRRKDYLKSGWVAQVDVTGLRPGRYRLSAYAWNSIGEIAPLTETGGRAVKIMPTTSVKPSLAQPSLVGTVDLVQVSASGKMLEAKGWAGDLMSGAPVERVDIRLNNRIIDIAKLGEQRRDVSRSLKRDDFLKAGWIARIDLTGLPSGSYRLSAYAWNRKGESAPLNGSGEIRIP